MFTFPFFEIIFLFFFIGDILKTFYMHIKANIGRDANQTLALFKFPAAFPTAAKRRERVSFCIISTFCLFTFHSQRFFHTESSDLYNGKKWFSCPQKMYFLLTCHYNKLLRGTKRFITFITYNRAILGNFKCF